MKISSKCDVCGEYLSYTTNDINVGVQVWESWNGTHLHGRDEYPRLVRRVVSKSGPKKGAK